MMVQICDQVTGESRWDGAQKKNVYGCYVHGIFDDREVADALIGALLEEKDTERKPCTPWTTMLTKRSSIRFLQMQFVRIWI